MKKDIRLKGQLRFYMQWPIFMLILLVAMTIWIFFYEQSGRNHDGNHCDSVWNRSRCALYVQ